MATNTQWLCTYRMRDTFVLRGHALPLGLWNLCNCGGLGKFSAPIGDRAQGLSLPIPGASPPTSS